VAQAAETKLLQVIGALHPPRRLPRRCTAGSKSEIKMPMIVMTIKSSTKVKAPERGKYEVRSTEYGVRLVVRREVERRISGNCGQFRATVDGYL